MAQLGRLIQSYNTTVANHVTPAGQMFDGSGLMTLAQLQALGGVAPFIRAPQAGQVGVSPLRAFDLRLSWIHKFGERFEIDPNVGFYNLSQTYKLRPPHPTFLADF